jgi:hypothetical protein
MHSPDEQPPATASTFSRLTAAPLPEAWISRWYWPLGRAASVILVYGPKRKCGTVTIKKRDETPPRYLAMIWISANARGAGLVMVRTEWIRRHVDSEIFKGRVLVSGRSSGFWSDRMAFSL